MLALTVAGAEGCRTSAGLPADTGSGARAGQLLVPDENGRIDRSTSGSTGIQGHWFAAADTDACQKDGNHVARECSFFVSPDPRAPNFQRTGDLGMCTVGGAAKVLARPDGNIDWANMWGARIGVTLSDDGPYDALAHGVTGFAFHMDAEPPPNTGLRVELFTLATSGSPAVWGGPAADTSPVHAGHNEFRWTEVGGPAFLNNPPPFDPTQLLSIAFTVPSSPSGPKSFSFCISQLAALEY